MQSVLITGSGGFVGSHLAHELSQHQYRVFGLERHEQLTEPPFADIYQADITDPIKLGEIVKQLQPDFICHLAAQASPALSFKQPHLTFEINLLGTLNIFEAVRHFSPQTKILVVGSADEYGHIDADQLPITEQTSFNPQNPYAVSKLASYYLSRQYTASYQLPLIYASPFPHTGPGQREGFFITDMCIQIANIEARRQPPTILTGDLSASRDYSDVRDIVRGYRLLLTKGRVGERYNLCSGTSRKISDLLDQLLALSTQKISHQFDQSRMRPSDIPIIYGSHQKITDHTGWQPEIPFAQTLTDTLNWYRHQTSV